MQKELKLTEMKIQAQRESGGSVTETTTRTNNYVVARDQKCTHDSPRRDMNKFPKFHKGNEVQVF